MKQPALLEVGARAASCTICGAPAVPRCRICAKGEWPRPGSRTWRAWVDGIITTIRARLGAAGMRDRAAMDAIEALLSGDRFAPDVAPLLADMAALPISPRVYRLWERRAIVDSQLYLALRQRGMGGEDATKEAERLAGAWLQEQLAPRRIEAEPERIRVEAPRLRIEDLGIEIATEDATEDEAHEEAGRVAVRRL